MTDDGSQWAVDRCVSHMSFLMHQGQLLSLCRRSVEMAPRLVDLAEVIGDAFTGDLRVLRAQAELAEQERALSFTNIHCATLMVVWGGLEAFVEDIVVLALGAEPQLLSADEIGSFKIPLRDVIGRSDEALARVLLDTFKARSGLRGVSQFEALLELVGLGGEVDSSVRAPLFAMNAVRNLVAHRAGRVDARFMRDCPSRAEVAGDLIVVGVDEVEGYLNAATSYSAEVVRRVGERHPRQREWLKWRFDEENLRLEHSPPSAHSLAGDLGEAPVVASD